MDTKIEKLQIVLNQLVENYLLKPIKYFYEEDIRAELLYHLTKEDNFNINLPITDKNEWLRDYVKILDKETNISGIKAEYPSTTRFDIAYINPNSIIPDNYSNHYIFECLFAIEIKLSQKDNKNSEFKSDIKKLFDYKRLYPTFTGIAINFEQHPTYDINKVKDDYNNFDSLKLIELEKPISISENSINYFFITKYYVLGGIVNAT